MISWPWELGDFPPSRLRLDRCRVTHGDHEGLRIHVVEYSSSLRSGEETKSLEFIEEEDTKNNEERTASTAVALGEPAERHRVSDDL